MDSILHQLSLGTLSESFSNERIDPGVALYTSNSALTDLGVNTIDDRIGLRELCTKYVSNQGQSDEDDGNAAASGTTLSGRDSVRQERSLLFQANSTAGVRSASSERTHVRKGRGLYSLCVFHLASRRKHRLQPRKVCYFKQAWGVRKSSSLKLIQRKMC